jgi:hypothetical protein
MRLHLSGAAVMALALSSMAGAQQTQSTTTQQTPTQTQTTTTDSTTTAVPGTTTTPAQTQTTTTKSTTTTPTDPMTGQQTAPAESTATTTTTTTDAAAIVKATADDVKKGASVYDEKGGTVGTVESVSAKEAIVSTGKIRVPIPISSFAKNDKGLVISMTKAELEAKAPPAKEEKKPDPKKTK